MPPAGFESKVPVIERPHTHALEPAAARIGSYIYDYFRMLPNPSPLPHLSCMMSPSQIPTIRKSFIFILSVPDVFIPLFAYHHAEIFPSTLRSL